MSELGKPFLTKSDQKTKIENQCQNAAKENKKPLARNVSLILTKTRPRMINERIANTI